MQKIIKSFFVILMLVNSLHVVFAEEQQENNTEENVTDEVDVQTENNEPEVSPITPETTAAEEEPTPEPEPVKKNGFVYEGDLVYYYVDDVEKFGLIVHEEKRYFLNDNHTLATGWIKSDNKWYYFDAKGVGVVGWIKWENNWYYCDNKTGVMKTGWLKDGNNWYLLNGADSGRMLKGWKKVSGKWYYMGDNGVMYANKWFKYNNKWYYLSGSGAMVSGRTKVEGQYETFALSGEWKKQATIKYLSQKNNKWAWKTYGGKSMYKTGCLPTGMTMAINAILNTNYKPTEMASYIYNNGLFNTSKYDGAPLKAGVALAKKYKLNYSIIKSEKELHKALQDGKIVLAAMNPGTFAPKGLTHIIVLQGYKNNKIYAYDPSPYAARRAWYNASIFWKQKSTDKLDQIEGTPFIALW